MPAELKRNLFSQAPLTDNQKQVAGLMAGELFKLSREKGVGVIQGLTVYRIQEDDSLELQMQVPQGINLSNASDYNRPEQMAYFKAHSLGVPIEFSASGNPERSVLPKQTREPIILFDFKGSKLKASIPQVPALSDPDHVNLE